MIVRDENMGCLNPVFNLFVCLFFLSNLLIIIQYITAQPDYIYHFCLGDNYSTDSTFAANLNHLFSSISISNRYDNTTAGRNPDTVYGSVQCRGDVTLDACQSCVDFGTQDINNRCPTSKKAFIWYGECMLRYSNEYYFNIMQITPAVYIWDPISITDPEQFNPVLADLMDELEKQRGSSFSNFATGYKNLTNDRKVYGLVQCSPDILSNDCSRCLLGAISELPSCCDGKQGGRVIRPSCNIRYELYPFLQYTNAPSPPLLSAPVPVLSPPPLILPPPLVSPPSSTNTTTPNSNGNNSSILAISIVVPSFIVVLSAIGFWFFCFERKKKKTEYFD
ncbi:hypothetical protein MKW94_011513, partial [Papaver nudicaule]|nr:hypothetical protein [Papaver nudicaule]